MQCNTLPTDQVAKKSTVFLIHDKFIRNIGVSGVSEEVRDVVRFGFRSLKDSATSKDLIIYNILFDI